MVSDTYLEIALEQLTTGGAANPPTTRYWGLRYSTTGNPASGVELTAGGYARVAMTTATFWTAGTFPDGSPAQVNAADLDFGTPSGADWGYVNELCLYDGATDTDPQMIFNIYDGTGITAVYLRDAVPVIFGAGEVILYAQDP